MHDFSYYFYAEEMHAHLYFDRTCISIASVSHLHFETHAHLYFDRTCISIAPLSHRHFDTHSHLYFYPNESSVRENRLRCKGFLKVDAN